LYKAGRDARHGKKDLERYLDIDPGNSTACGLLGGFLYFADTIPDAFKFISKLLMMPTGDRVRGIELLETAVAGGGLLETDWRLILYNVYFYFEGRYEEGLAGLQMMNERHPYFPRTAVPLAVSRIWAPQQAAEHNARVTNTVNRLFDQTQDEVDWNAVYLVQFFRAVGDRYCDRTSVTLAGLRNIIDDEPKHPDWVLTFARLELGRLYASRGDRRSARELFETVKKTSSVRDLRDEARTNLQDLEKYTGYVDRPAPQMDAWVATLYKANPDSLQALKSRFRRVSAGSLIAKFYLAEALLLSGELESAMEVYYEVIQADVPSWDHTYQMIGSMRIAEIYAANKRYESAARFAAYAMNFYHREYLVDWVIGGRQRYFERLASGEETTPPTLLTSRP
jgi:tetratricopeptide (TPR) repeat protein